VPRGCNRRLALAGHADDSSLLAHLGNWPDFTAEHEHGSPALMTAFTEDAVFESQEGSGSVRLKKRLSRLPDDPQAPANLLG
jgi:hypothetical protein